MKPTVILTHYAYAEAIDLLASVCDVSAVRAHCASSRLELAMRARHADALMLVTPDGIDDALLAGCRNLKIVSCAFRIPEHVDIAACTRRGIWVTNVLTRNGGRDAELEAARNILDALGGDPPRSALNFVLQPAA